LWKGFFAGAIVDTNLMDAIIVDDHEVVVYSRLWIDAAFTYSMTKLNAQPDPFQRRGLEKCSIPALRVKI
jgi:hypothetical protein